MNALRPPKIPESVLVVIHTPALEVLLIKRADANGYFFTQLGQGSIDCARILRSVAQTDLNLSIEIPLRLRGVK